ncbi:MAG: hypothetical protein M1113_02260 [Candidatus Thermoplasmatota archaeon]|nr:hypothetical protein [Candidatus Thermoplasmatota archaeon]
MSNHKHFMVFGSILLASIMLISMLYVAAPVSNQSNSTIIAYNEVGSAIKDNITFTGNVATDFSGHLIYHNTHTSLWGQGDNISDLYLAYNSTYLFIGLNETIGSPSSNNLMLFFSNDTSSGYGLYNLSKCSAANGYGGSQGINFTSPINDLFTVYFSSPSTPDTPALKQITSTTSQSNSSVSAKSVNMTYLFDATHNSTEIAIPFSSLYPLGNYSEVNLSLSAFVVGDGGSPGNWAWVGTGIPYNQTGKYDAGSTIPMFTVNNSYVFTLHNISAQKVVVKSTPPPPPPSNSVPINLNIMFNDHQPCYKVVGSNNYVLPWTEAHATAEYIEQALILHEFPSVNITYELSGVLLSQLVNISSDINFNDSYIQGAFLPWSEINASQSLYNNLTLDYFSIPGYVFALGEPASNLYSELHTEWENGQRLTEQQFEDAKVLWFLYDVSTPLVEGQLGSSWKNSTMWSFHNMTSFNQSDLVKILSYSKWLVGQVIPAFKNDIIGNPNGSQNAELFTSPFYHPLVPLLLTTNLTGPDGTITKSSYYSDVMAQINISFGQFNHLFGQYPSGLYSPEAAVTYEMIQAVNESGAKWFQSAQATLDNSGVDALAYGDSGSNVTTMENLYQPYEVVGPNNTTADMFFRDGYLSDQWGFNYGNEPTWTAVDSFINYLKNIYNEIPMSHHNQTVVTVLLDGENWMFMSPFVEDGVPFLEDLYTALEQNSSYIRTVTPTQYLEFASAHHITLKKIHHLATASWNDGQGSPLPYESNIYLTQWAGDTVQDFYWQALQTVRSDVVAFQQQHDLVQLQNYTQFEQNMTASTPEGNLTRAWNAIYDAEGSDWYFTMAPWTIGGSNTIPFDYLFKGDLSYALKQLDLPVPVFLTESPSLPLTEYKAFNDSIPLTATLNGYYQYTTAVSGGIGFSVNNATSWSYAASYNSTPESLPQINNVSIDYDANDLLVNINVSGNPSKYLAGNNTIQLFFSEPDQGYSSNISMDVQSATYQTSSSLGSVAIGFPAVYMITMAPSTFTNGAGAGEYNVYASSGFGVWSYQFQDTSVPAYVGSSIQFMVPFTYLNLVPGNSYEMAVFAGLPSQHEFSIMTPIYQTIPLSLAKYTPISSIHNTVPDNGPGNYTYPTLTNDFPNGSLDMQWINVSMNSYDMKWQFTFGNLSNVFGEAYGFSDPIINVFISDGGSSGSTSLGAGPNANTTVPWQAMLYISGTSVYAQNEAGTYTSGIIVTVNHSSRTITTVFPLSDIGSNPLTDKYVIVSGSQDGYGVDGWRVVDATASSYQGGGGDPPWSSNIYDYIAPATVGQGTETQQQLLSYSVGKIPTLVPISLPSVSNVSTTTASYFNPTLYNDPSITEFDSKYYVSFISNKSSSANHVFISESSNMQVWSNPVPVSGTSGAVLNQLVASNSTMYLTYLDGSGQYRILSSSNGNTWVPYYNGTGNVGYFSTSYYGGSLYVLTGSMQSNGSYNYSLTTLVSGKAVRVQSLPFYSISPGSISVFSGYAALSYYAGTTANETIYLQVLDLSNLKVVATVTDYGQTNLTGQIAIASDSAGNVFIAYTYNVSGQYSMYLTNSTPLKDPKFARFPTLMVTSSEISNYPSIYLSNTGGNNYTVLFAWHSVTTFQNMVWAMKSTYSFQQSSITLPPAKSTSDLLYIIVGVVIAAVVIALISLLYVSRKKKPNQ